ncbi:Mth938-like domain-containing protein [Methylocapsa polymorpha]|uniref:Mth938-like domain-containing protein n=1 Tax=Methylocapsa polymorpha TaxID=3080828 RepID=A0ABZ0HSB6_9HYPH|nr:Mth938-like domain-containing protein [Methylocapsa sp. RX1]
MAEQKYSGFLPGAHAIEGYGGGGFRFGSMSHRGSILALPSGIYAWSAVTPADINMESLAPLFAEPPGMVEHLLVGTGTELVPLNAALRQRLREAGVRAEPMATGAAARTYSILLGENRRVAAALLAAP